MCNLWIVEYKLEFCRIEHLKIAIVWKQTLLGIKQNKTNHHQQQQERLLYGCPVQDSATLFRDEHFSWEKSELFHCVYSNAWTAWDHLALLWGGCFIPMSNRYMSLSSHLHSIFSFKLLCAPTREERCPVSTPQRQNTILLWKTWVSGDTGIVYFGPKWN